MMATEMRGKGFLTLIQNIISETGLSHIATGWLGPGKLENMKVISGGMGTFSVERKRERAYESDERMFD